MRYIHVNEMQFRHLVANDYHKGYLQLLEQLTTVGNITEEEFKERLRLIDLNICHNIMVCEKDNLIIASGTLLIEPKFIHSNGYVGHIEDVVVCNSVRGTGLGHKLIEHLMEMAQMAGCYKVICNCKEELTGFYENCSFMINGVEMRYSM